MVQKMLKICIHKFEYTFYEDVLYQKIADQGINVWYVTYKSNKSYWKKPLPVKVRAFIRKLLSDAIEIPFTRGSEKFSLLFVKILLREKFTIVVFPLGPLVTLFYLIIARLVGSITVCHLTVHKFPGTFIGSIRSIIIRASRFLSDYVITLTDMHKETLIKMGFPAEMIFVIPHGVDAQLFAPNPPDKHLMEKFNLHGKKVILYIGRLTKEKGIYYLIQAVKLVTKKIKDVCLLVVGEGPLRNSLKKIVHGLNGHIKLIGTVPSNNIPGFFSICDVFVAPSISTKHFVEPFGMVYLEAMACGKPIVAFDIPAPVRHIIVNGETGYLVPAKDVNMLVKRICELLMDDKKRFRMGGKARRRAIINYDVKKIAVNWANTLKYFIEDRMPKTKGAVLCEMLKSDRDK